MAIPTTASAIITLPIMCPVIINCPVFMNKPEVLRPYMSLGGGGYSVPMSPPFVVKLYRDVLHILSCVTGEAIHQPLHNLELGVHIPINHYLHLPSITQTASALQFLLPIILCHRNLDTDGGEGDPLVPFHYPLNFTKLPQ